MPRIARESIERVQAAADIVEIVGQYTELRKAGAAFSGRCPFHEERTPSFSVNPTEKLYYCFGCGVGGDLFGFVQAKESLDFAGAVEYLADRYGITLEYEQMSPHGDAERRRRERLRALLEQATVYYERVLRESRAAAPAREYLARRGLGDEVCRRFRVGYSLPGWERLREAARSARFTDQELLDAGLVLPGRRGSPYDRFRGRIMFPLADDRGRTLGFGARTLGDEKPKYLNSPETPLYHKSEAVFGMGNARAAATRADRMYVVEGYTDVLALAQVGVENAVASMGTALTAQQLGRLSRVTRNLYLCFDADAAGIGAMSRALSLGRTMGLRLHVVRIPEGLDPADYVLSGAGREGFAALAERAQTLLQFHVRLTLSSYDLEKPDGRAGAFAQLRGILREAATPLERDDELRTIADALQLSPEAARYLVSGAGEAPERAGPSSGPQHTPSLAGRGTAYELEVRFLAGCLARSEQGRAIVAGLDEEYFATAQTRLAFAAVRERLIEEHEGQLGGGAEGEPSAAADEVLAEVAVRAGRERFTAVVLDELFLRLQEAQVSRLIAKLKLTVEGDETGSQREELMALQKLRRSLREARRRIPIEEELERG